MSEPGPHPATIATQRWPKCDSTRLATDIRVGDLGDGNYSRELSLEIQERPEALIFKRTQRYPLKATVCGDCGFTEFYASYPADLLKVHEEQKRRKS